MFSQKSRQVLRPTLGVFIIPVLLWAGSALAGGIFVDAGGPYKGAVGEEIEFDAGASSMLDGSAIECYYWDWCGDGYYECFSSPKAKHTWHSAFSGKVRVYIFYPDGVDWAEAQVTIEGPETSMSITVSDSAQLRLRDERGRFLGINPNTGLFDMDIARCTIARVPPEIGSVGVFKEAPTSQWATQYNIPLVGGSTYDLTLTGMEREWFELRIQGVQDGVCCSDEYLVGLINPGEQIKVDVSAWCNNGNLAIECGPLRYRPELKVDPDEIKLTVQPGGRYEATITVSETEGLRPIWGITLTCTELAGTGPTIPISHISFDKNAFNLNPGGKEEVTMTVEIPEFFAGQVAGTVTVQCAGGQSEEIDVIVRKAGVHAPTIEVVSPVYGVVGTPTKFDATGSSDMDGGIETYCWDWDLTDEYECLDDPVCEHTWDVPFNSVVRLRVVDDEGHMTEQYVQVVITEPE